MVNSAEEGMIVARLKIGDENGEELESFSVSQNVGGGRQSCTEASTHERRR